MQRAVKRFGIGVHDAASGSSVCLLESRLIAYYRCGQLPDRLRLIEGMTVGARKKLPALQAISTVLAPRSDDISGQAKGQRHSANTMGSGLAPGCGAIRPVRRGHVPAECQSAIQIVRDTFPGIVLPFCFVRVLGNRVLVSGHDPQNPDGSFAEPLGKLGREVPQQGYTAARLIALSILASLKRALGDLDRVAAWSRVFGMVNSAPGFQQRNVINGFPTSSLNSMARKRVPTVAAPWA